VAPLFVGPPVCDCASICLSVGHNRQLCENDWTDRDAVWGGHSRETKNRVSVGAWITVQCKGQFLKVDISWPTVKYREHPASAEVIRHVATAMRPSAVSTAATCFYFIGLGRSNPSFNMSKGSRLVCDAIASLLHYVLQYPSSVVCRLMEFF